VAAAASSCNAGSDAASSSDGGPSAAGVATGSPHHAADVLEGVVTFDRWRVSGAPCLESAGAEEIGPGDSVELRGADGNVLQSTLLVPSQPGDDQSCSLEFSMGDVPPSDSYSFAVAGRETRAFSAAELSALDWHVDLSPDSGVYAEPSLEIDGQVRLVVTAPVQLTLEAPTVCLVSTDTRYPELGLLSIRLEAGDLGTYDGRRIGLSADLKLMRPEAMWLAFLDLDVLVNGEAGYHASASDWGGGNLVTLRLEAGNARGEISLAHMPAVGSAPPLDTAVPGAEMAATVTWACGVTLDPAQLAGEVHVGAPLKVDATINGGRCDPETPDGWRPMSLSFSGQSPWGSVSGELTRMSPFELDLQLIHPNAQSWDFYDSGYGTSQMLTSVIRDGESSSTTADGTRYAITALLDFGRIGAKQEWVRDVPFDAWWVCPADSGEPVPDPFG
jgi:hypothetical protein